MPSHRTPDFPTVPRKLKMPCPGYHLPPATEDTMSQCGDDHTDMPKWLTTEQQLTRWREPLCQTMNWRFSVWFLEIMAEGIENQRAQNQGIDGVATAPAAIAQQQDPETQRAWYNKIVHDVAEHDIGETWLAGSWIDLDGRHLILHRAQEASEDCRKASSRGGVNRNPFVQGSDDVNLHDVGQTKGVHGILLTNWRSTPYPNWVEILLQTPMHWSSCWCKMGKLQLVLTQGCKVWRSRLRMWHGRDTSLTRCWSGTPRWFLHFHVADKSAPPRSGTQVVKCNHWRGRKAPSGLLKERHTHFVTQCNSKKVDNLKRTNSKRKRLKVCWQKGCREETIRPAGWRPSGKERGSNEGCPAREEGCIERWRRKEGGRS